VNKGSCEDLEFFGGFGDFFECLKGFGPIRNYFSETEGPVAKVPARRDCGAISNKLRGLNAKR
jgi:hypothetical protein